MKIQHTLGCLATVVLGLAVPSAHPAGIVAAFPIGKRRAWPATASDRVVSHEDSAHPRLSGNGRPWISRLQRPPSGHRGRLPTAAGIHIPAPIPPDLLCRGNGLLCGCTLAPRGGREEFLRPRCFGCWSDSVLGDLCRVAGPALRLALDRQTPAPALARARRSPDRG